MPDVLIKNQRCYGADAECSRSRLRSNREVKSKGHELICFLYYQEWGMWRNECGEAWQEIVERVGLYSTEVRNSNSQERKSAIILSTPT